MNEINGVICINKPQDFTSFDVVAIMRRAAGTRKIGHGGTLDPMATGVLPIYIGRAAKTADLNPVSDKRYRATFRLGVTTDTEDVWGKVLTKSEKPDAVKTMQGDIMQIPPMYSAVKINGKRLYDLARQGVEVERAARPVTVYSIELSDYDEEKRTGTLDIYCSKGTYIRTIISDIGKKLGTGAIMTSLCRTMAAGFMDGTQKKLFMNGMILDCGRMDISYPEGTCLRLKHEGDFLGVARVNGENGLKSVYLNILS